MDHNQATTAETACVPVDQVRTKMLQDNMIQLKRTWDDNDAPEIRPQKKLCRYYYLDQCTKAESCFFMHSEFPCKFYYFGYECKDGKNCKLRHGAALNPEIKQALWDHVMSAPANLLQRFPCFPQVLLKKNFDDRHDELIQMEQEGLLKDDEPCTEKECAINPVSSTLLSEVIKTVSKTQVTNDTFANLGELVEILSPEQISSLVSIGVETMDQLLQLGANSLLNLGFDFGTLIKIGNFKEMQSKKSIYTTEIYEKSHDQNDINTSDIFGSEVLDVSLTVPVDQPTLTDQELLSILNEDLNTSIQDTEASLFGNDSKICTKLNDYFPESHHTCYATFTEFSRVEFDDLTAASDQSSECILKTFQSDVGNDCQQLMLYPSANELENVEKSLNSIERIHQKIDSTLMEEKKQDFDWGSEESHVSANHGTRHYTFVTDSVNQSYVSDSDSQTCFRMPFKSIINRYTPATEIDASNVKFVNKQYKLIPVEVPKPNFERIRRTFVTLPSYSLDPRIQIMFNIGPKKVCHGDRSQVSNRDPRLKKSGEVNFGDAPEKPA